MLGLIGPTQTDTFSDLNKPSKKFSEIYSDASSLKQASQSSFTTPSNTYSDTKSNASTVKPVRVSSSTRNSNNFKELSINKPAPARPLTSTLIDLLDDNLSDFEGIEDLDDTI